MSIKEFKKTIIKANWYDKYFYYILGIAIILVGVFFIYDRLSNPLKYYSRNTQSFIFLAASFFIFLGAFSIYKIPSRYKVLTIASEFSSEQLKKAIPNIFREFNVPFNESGKEVWSFEVRGKRSSKYVVWLALDEKKLYVSVLLGTLGRSGFIDFGETEKFRQKLIPIINKYIN